MTKPNTAGGKGKKRPTPAPTKPDAAGGRGKQRQRQQAAVPVR